QITQTPPVPPRQIRPELPAPAEAALLRALAKKPSERFSTPGALASAFTLGLQGIWAPGLRAPETLAAFVPQPPAFPAQGQGHARRGMAVVGISALALVAVVGTLLVSGVLRFGGGASTPQVNGGGTATATRVQPTATTLPSPSPSPSPS